MPGMFDDVPITETQDPKSKLSKGENWATSWRGISTPTLKLQACPKLETGAWRWILR